jgi:hypothetical protein
MARNTNSGCLCRVPLGEADVPVFGTAAELNRWAAARGIEILPDHRGRPSVSMADAYALHAEAEVASRARREADEARAVAERAELVAAQENRQAVHTATYKAAVRRGKGTQEASQLAWEAVHKAERGLSQQVRDRLGQVRVPAVYGAGVSAGDSAVVS